MQLSSVTWGTGWWPWHTESKTTGFGWSCYPSVQRNSGNSLPQPVPCLRNRTQLHTELNTSCNYYFNYCSFLLLLQIERHYWVKIIHSFSIDSLTEHTWNRILRARFTSLYLKQKYASKHPVTLGFSILYFEVLMHLKIELKSENEGDNSAYRFFFKFL